ncbi:MAG: hypothetical protein LBO71_09385, partial [Prevotellaceae bacterium]|nr:hypothetical protein [Prevotellaceae bacterium]
MKHLHFQKAIKRFMPFVPFVVIHFFIRDILLALAIVLNYSYIVNDNLSAIVEIALYVMFTGGVFTWYIKRKGYREFILLKNTTTFVVVFLILIFSLQYLKHTVFESSITKYQLFTLHWRQFDSIVLALNSENQLMIGSVLDTGIFAPVFESILTIGLLQKPLYQKVSSYKAILIAAAVFSLLHW